MRILTMLLLSIALALTSVRAQAAEPQDAPQATCPAEAPKCWYLVFGRGDAPALELLFANSIATEAAEGIRKTEMLHVFQNHPKIQYIVYSLDVRCETKEARAFAGYAIDKAGAVANKNEVVTPWVKYDKHYFGRAVELLCNPDVISKPQNYDVAYAADMVRPADVVALVRRTFFGTP